MAVNGVEIEVGQVWQTRGGWCSTVQSIDDDDPVHPINMLEVGGMELSGVTSNGCAMASGRHDDGDLVELVRPAPAKTAACARREANERLSDNPCGVSFINPVLDRLAALKAFGESGAVAAALKAFGEAGAGAVPAERPHIDSGLKMLSEYEKAERDSAFVESLAVELASGGGKLERKANYYQVDIARPVDPESAPYLAECADIIEALNMTFNEGEAFKALWRLAAARQGRAKAGGNPVYDADKVAHYGARTAAHTRAQNGGAA